MGNVRCNKCGHRRDRPGACACGSLRVYISIFWHKKEWKIWRFTDGYLLDYERAQALLGEIRVKLSKGTFNPVDYSRVKMEEMLLKNKIDEWLTIKAKEMEQDIIRPSSYSNMCGHVQIHIVPGLGDQDVRNVGQDELRAFRDGLNPDLKNKTKKNIFATLHAFFQWCYEQDIRPMPSFPELAGESDAREPQALEPGEQQDALSRIPAGIKRDMLELGMETGIRPGELVSLKVGDFDLLHKTGRVNRTVSARTHVLEGTKGRSRGKPRKRRRLLLTDRAATILETYCAGRFGAEWVFVCPRTHKRYSVYAPNRIWKKHTGLDVTYYEASRHSLATQLAGEMDAFDLMLVMGHSDVRTSQKYVHRKLENLRSKMEAARGNVVQLSQKKGGIEE